VGGKGGDIVSDDEDDDQYNFFFRRNVRPSDPETSHEAAARDRINDRRKCLVALWQNPEGLTDYELADLVGRQQNSAGKRRGELRDLGYVEATNIRRDAPSGSRCIVWRVTAAGAAWAMIIWNKIK
jgi:hypothetical protein